MSPVSIPPVNTVPLAKTVEIPPTQYASSTPIKFIPAKMYRPADLSNAIDYDRSAIASREIMIDANHSKDVGHFHNKVQNIVKDLKIPAVFEVGKDANRIVLNTQTDNQFYSALRRLLKLGEVKLDFDKAVTLKHFEKLI